MMVGGLPRFRAALEVEQVEQDGKRRVVLSDPDTGVEIRLGEKEYQLALLFDGTRTPEAISAKLSGEGKGLAPEKLAALRDKLLKAGVLELPGEIRPRVDPRSGVPLTGFRRWTVRKLVEIRGDRWLVGLLKIAPWLGSAWFLALVTALVAGGVALAFAGHARLGGDLAEMQPSRWRFWILLFVVGHVVNALHEVGHAVATRAQGVRVLSVGLILDLCVVSAWTKPDRSYAGLSRPGRLACIAAGPLCSFACGAACVAGWWLSAPGSGAAGVWLTCALASVIGALVSLVPFHPGDGYLVLADLSGEPELRRRAFHELARRLGLPRAATAASAPAASGPLWLAAFALGMLVWRVVLAGAILWLISWMPPFARLRF
jgi:putative peptide zinc metalloprotease protein